MEFYNPKSYPISITAEGGGRITLYPAAGRRLPTIVKGEYYAGLVKMGMLAVWDKKAVKAHRQMALNMVQGKIPEPEPQTPLGSFSENEDELIKASREPLRKDPDVSTKDIKPMFTKEQLEGLTKRELVSIIEAHDLGSYKHLSRKSDYIQFILSNT